MKLLKFIMGWLLLFSFVLIFSAQTVKLGDRNKNAVVAFVNVNVVPMDRERILYNQTVIVRDGIISEIGAAETIKVPADALRIDGKTNLFLMPGLADMHSHLRYDGDLLLYVANGVTTVRNMSGSPEHLKWREEIEKEEVLGPTIYTAGPILKGEVKNAAEAQRIVNEQKNAGYDFIKVYDQLPKDAYEGVIAAAAKLKMQVAGHVPTAVGVEGVLKAKQASIEHAEQFVYHYFGNYDSFNLDKTKIPYIAQETKKAGTYVCPTLGIIENYILLVDNQQKLFSRPELKYTHPETYAWWHTQHRDSSSANKAIYAFQKDLVKGFRDAGVPMLAGTDIYNIGFVAGFSLHRELQELVDAGLTPYQALETSTKNAGEYFRKNFGTIAVGSRADLILIDKNPLEDIKNISLREGVMVRGRWFTDAELKLVLNDLEQSYSVGQMFVKLVVDGKPEQAVQTFHDFTRNKKEIIQSQRYVFDSMGKLLLRENRTKDAIEILKLNVENFPQLFRVYDSLAEAYLADGNKKMAIENYKKSLQLNPQNSNAAEQLKKLE